MQNIFLTSAAYRVLDDIYEHLNDELRSSQVLFITTAGNTYEKTPWIEKDRDALLNLGFTIREIDITQLNTETIKQHLDDCGIIFMCGGNTFYLLQEIQKAQLTSVLQDAIENGKVYIGSSAGSIILSSDIGYIASLDDPEDAPELQSTQALNRVGYYIIPHAKSESYQVRIRSILDTYQEKLSNVILLEDHQYIWQQADHYKIITA